MTDESGRARWERAYQHAQKRDPKRYLTKSHYLLLFNYLWQPSRKYHGRPTE